MISVHNYLDPLEADRIKILVSSENAKIRSLATSFFKFRIPLEPTAGRDTVKAISVRPLVDNTDKILVGLLWEACFGKKFKVIHWHILMHVLIRTIEKDRQSEALLAILTIMTANAATSNWSTNMVPLRTILFKKLDEDKAQNLLEYLLDSLPIRLPKKRPTIEKSLSVKLDGSIKQKRPREISRIGVGYKDKGGGVGTGGNEPFGTNANLEPDQTFESLLRQVKHKYVRLIT